MNVDLMILRKDDVKLAKLYYKKKALLQTRRRRKK
jgi:hypothetical protein